MIDQRTVEKINDAVNILDVIKDFEPRIRKAGQNYQCLCPFHPDKSMGSFSISPKRNICYCFSCGKGGDAVYYLMEAQKMSYPDALRYLGKKYNIEVEGMEKFKHVPVAKPRDYQLVTQDLPVFELPMSMYERSARRLDEDVFVKWLKTNNWDASQKERIPQVLKAYKVGTATTKRGEQYTVFWYTDEYGKLRTGKMIRYKYNGKRMKKEDGVKNATDWVHAWLYRSPVSKEFDREKVDWKRTYFGMHLVDQMPGATINIVESEKTALIMSIAYGDPARSLWVACGSKENLTPGRLHPLMARGRSIVLYPDRDGVDDWIDTANAIGYQHMTVNTDPVLKWWKECDGPKADIADVVLRMTNERPLIKTVGDVVDKYPQMEGMVKKFDMEIVK